MVGRLAPGSARRRRRPTRWRARFPRAPRSLRSRAYLVGLSRSAVGREARRRPGARDAAVQLVPLGAPLLLSTDAWTYWGYGWIADRPRRQPVRACRPKLPSDPGASRTRADWRDTTTVYGPAFTLASEPVARVAGSSADAAAWIFKALAAPAAVVAPSLASRLARGRRSRRAFVGWNPLLAIHLAGGGHNDAWMAALVGRRPALAAAGRRAARAPPWALAVLVKWIPLVFLPLRRSRRAGRPARAHLGFAARRCGRAGPRDVAVRAPLALRFRPARRERRTETRLRAPVSARAARASGLGRLALASPCSPPPPPSSARRAGPCAARRPPRCSCS